MTAKWHKIHSEPIARLDKATVEKVYEKSPFLRGLKKYYQSQLIKRMRGEETS